MANRNQDETNRADQVRARRQQGRKETPTTPFGSSATRKPKSQTVPVTRRTTTPVPVVTRKKQTTYVPLKKKGAELQVPALPRIHLGWRLISGAVFLLSLAVVISFTSVSTFQVNSIRLTGAERLNPDVVFSQIDLAGKTILQVVPEDVKTTLEEAFPGVKNASVMVGFPAVVTIRVEEREPVILWMEESSSYWIDAEGIMFPVFGEAEVLQIVSAAGSPPPAPEVFTPDLDDETGTISHLLDTRWPSTTPAFVEAVLSLREIVPEESVLQYNPQFGLGWQDPNGWLVYFGQDTSYLEMKLAGYQHILAELQDQNVNPALISLEFLHAPFIRLEQ